MNPEPLASKAPSPGSNPGATANSGPGQDLSRVSVTHDDGVAHITFPSGKADGAAVRELFETVARMTDHHHIRVVIDLTGAVYVPSGMMGMLVTVKKRIASVGGQLHIVITDPLVRTSFTAMRLERILSLHDSLDDAIARFEK